MKLSLLVPSYNEEGNIKLFTETVENTFKNKIKNYEIIFINDGSGDATIVTLILLLGGIQLLCIGIIGEYLARTYVETKNRPIYITREIITNEKSKKNDKILI